MRLDKFLVAVGVASRSQAKSLVKAKRVNINGQTAKKADQKIDPDHDKISLDGQTLEYSEFDYLMLNKPAGVISATEDPRETTVLDLLPARYHRVAPVGRLDKDTVGLLLLTNDGHLTHNLLSPKKHVDKTYQVTLEKPCKDSDVAAMAEGIRLDDGYICQAATLVISENPHEALLTIQEGKFHQVKRMFLARDNRVTHLKRLSMGSLSLDESLDEGEFRPLTDAELASLRSGQSKS